MKIIINNNEYFISADEEYALLRQLQSMLLFEYDKVDIQWKLIAKPIAREILREMEITTRSKNGNDQALLMRPPKKSDPVIHLTTIMCMLSQEFLKNVCFKINSTTDNTITSFSISTENQSAAGGQVVVDGD